MFGIAGFRRFLRSRFGHHLAEPVKGRARRHLLELARSHVNEDEIDSLRVRVAVDLMMEDGVAFSEAWRATEAAIAEMRQVQRVN